ncbi:beta-N-acetylhexosaminidase [Bacteroides acidifaciens]|uniref:beta-N-acetylhexosaminidase n=1 Tax=Bacteroides acidifaciens TaxID=85831 RepID=UPI0020CA3E54|nr:beta-N-acetylhexosaminidase [Bacteroides acidifaciens]
MKRTSILFLLLACFFVSLSCKDNEADSGSVQTQLRRLSFMPLPEKIDYKEGALTLPKQMTISQELPVAIRQLLVQTLKDLSFVVSETANERAFIQISKDAELPEEGYRLAMETDKICIYYATDAGLLWGVQTVRQALEQATVQGGIKQLPLATVQDAPQYAWRGFHLDVARHMFTMDYLKKLVDCLSFYKINKFQIHLTDDEGWRIEMKTHPELAVKGGWREFDRFDKECIDKSQTDRDYELDSRFVKGNQYGGYYTQEEIKELIRYASDRGIDIIPEIDMPGHFSAAIRVYPELSCKGGIGWGEEFSDPICVSKESTYTLVKSMLDEVIALFPSPYFHIGGDEVEKECWKQCASCQRLMKEKGYTNVVDLQTHFMKIMVDYVKSKGKKVMGWDDAFDAAKPLDMTYTFWRNWRSDSASAITQQGFPLVFMEWKRFYFIYDPTDELLNSLYNFDFEPDFPGIAKNNLLGFQACVWTERIPNERKFGQQTFPSLQAFSEVSWGSQRSWADFVSRLQWHIQWLDKKGFSYTKPGFMKL